MRSRRRAAEHELDVGHRELGPRLDEGMQPAGHHRARAGAEAVGADHADRHAVEPHFAAERALVEPLEEDDHREVILQVLADRQIDDRLDAHLAQMRGRPDARQHEKLRRVERAAARITSRARLRTRHVSRVPLTYSTPVARVPCISTRVACAPVSTSRFFRLRAGLRYAVAADER